MKTYFLSLFMVSMCLTFLLTATSFAQTPPPEPKIEKKETVKPSPSPISSPTAPAPPPAMDFMLRPDYKAYTAGMNERNPVKKIALLEKYMADYPDSPFISTANENLLTAIVTAYPNDKERISAQAKKTIAGLNPESSSILGISMISRTYNSVVAALYKAGLTDEAQKYALEAFKLFDTITAKQVLDAKRPMWVSMGNDYLKKGDYKKAETYFKQAMTGEYEGNEALLGLAEVAEKRKKPKLQLEYLTLADSKGSLKTADRNKLEEIYVRVKGSKEGLREVLDESYKKANPFPFQPAKYVPTEKRTKRTVLAELFTGSACAPCVVADLAFDGLLKGYSPSEVAVLVYHLHIPGPDPMTNPATVARARFYGGFGTPTYFINGTDKQTGGGINRKQAADFYNKLKNKIDPQLESLPEAGITLSAESNNQIINATVNYEGIPKDARDLKLNIALVEHELSYMGENGIRFHQMVVRELGGVNREGFSLKDAQGNFSWQFDLKKVSDDLKTYLDKYETETKKDRPEFAFSEKKHEINPKNLAVVAFIQDVKSKKILQSVFFDLASRK